MRLAALGVLGIAALAAGDERAVAATTGRSEPPLVTLSLDRCPAVAASEVADLVGVEMRRPVELVGEGKPPVVGPSATTVVRVSCEGLHAEIEIGDRLTGKTVERVVDLAAAAPVARPHLLALSIVELLAATWIELESNPRPASAAAPAGAAAAPETREAARELAVRRADTRRPPRLLVAATLQSSTAAPRLSGAAVVIARSAGAHLGWMVDVGFQRGERRFALGRVTADTVSALGAALVGTSRGNLALRAGAGIRGGGAWLSGTPADPATAVGGAVRGAWWGPVAVLDASLTVRGRFVLELMIEAGRVVLPVVATVQGADPVPIDGSWIKGGLGVGLTL